MVVESFVEILRHKEYEETRFVYRDILGGEESSRDMPNLSSRLRKCSSNLSRISAGISTNFFMAGVDCVTFRKYPREF